MIKQFINAETCLHTHCKHCIYIPERPLNCEIYYVTPSQYRVLEFLIQDLRDKEIGNRMHIAAATVKNHMTAVRKITAKGRIGISVLFVSGQIKIKDKTIG